MSRDKLFLIWRDGYGGVCMITLRVFGFEDNVGEIV